MRGPLDAAMEKWKRKSTGYAWVSAETTTDAFYRDLIGGQAGTSDATPPADGSPRLEKINAVDGLVHARSADFEELVRLATAEFAIELKRLTKRLDASRALLVFADHGFRIAPDGRRFAHGGASTLERLVPVLRYEPV
jgi:hypothetical protein